MNRTLQRVSTLSLAVLALAALAGCDDEGAVTGQGIFAALGEPLPSATNEQLLTFERGREVALHSFTREDGLGPDFNVVACAHCQDRKSVV